MQYYTTDTWTECDCSPTATGCTHQWYRYERKDESTNTDSSVRYYDVYGPKGEHYVEEHIIHTTSINVSDPVEEPVEVEREVFPVIRKKVSPRGRASVITKPPGGWFFHKG